MQASSLAGGSVFSGGAAKDRDGLLEEIQGFAMAGQTVPSSDATPSSVPVTRRSTFCRDHRHLQIRHPIHRCGTALCRAEARKKLAAHARRYAPVWIFREGRPALLSCGSLEFRDPP